MDLKKNSWDCDSLWSCAGRAGRIYEKGFFERASGPFSGWGCDGCYFCSKWLCHEKFLKSVKGFSFPEGEGDSEDSLVSYSLYRISSGWSGTYFSWWIWRNFKKCFEADNGRYGAIDSFFGQWKGDFRRNPDCNSGKAKCRKVFSHECTCGRRTLYCY